MTVQALDHLNLTVHSFDDTVAWYQRLFGFEVVEQGVRDGHPWGIIRSGDATLCIYEHADYPVVDKAELQARGHHRVNHFGLRISDRETWEGIVEAEGLEFSWPVTEWPHSTAWYLLDPTGHEIEVCLWHQGEPDFR